MKQQILFCILVFLFVANDCAYGQTQNGYVKTRGRLSPEGKVIPGSHLAGTLVKIKDRNSVISKNDGTFSLRIPESRYVIEKVEKSGFVIADPEVLSKEYHRSDDPLVLVMDAPKQQLEDKLLAERKIRKTLQKKLQEREDLIESLLEQHKIDSLEYQNQLEELYKSQEKDERLISEMAKRFSEIDYDQVDEFNKKINTYILDGELSKADSLLRTKGDLTSRAKDLKSLQDANNHIQEKLNKSKAYAQKELDDLSEDCFNRFQILRMQHQNDSAAYYICMMADLDTTQVFWQLQAAHFLDDIAEYNRSLFFSERALRVLNSSDENRPKMTVSCLNALGSTYQNIGRYDEALSYNKKALNILKAKAIGTSQDYSSLYNNIASVYSDKGQYNLAVEYYEKAIESATDSFDLATSYNNLGLSYNYLGNRSKALDMFQKSSQIDEKIGRIHSSVYNNMGNTYLSMGHYKSALDHLNKALEINLEEYGEYHPTVAINYSNLFNVYSKIGEYKLAMEYALKAVNSAKHLLSVNHPDIIHLYSNLGNAYGQLGDSVNAFIYLEKSVEICNKSKDASNLMRLNVYNNIGMAYANSGRVDEAMEYYNKILGIFQKDSLNNNDVFLALVYNNIGMGLMNQKEYLKAREFFKRGIDILENTQEKNVEDLILIYSNMADSYTKMTLYNPPIEYEDYIAPSFGYMNNYYTAQEYYDKCLALMDSINNETNPLFSHIYYEIGKVYGDNGKFPDAITYFLKSLPFLERNGKIDDLAQAYYKLGCCYIELLDYDNSLCYLLKTANLLTNKEGDNGLSLAEVYEDIGSVYDRKGDYKTAVDYFKKSLEYFNQHHEGHEDFIENLQEYIDYYGKK